MPTGYTSKLLENPDMTPEEFVMVIARAFGICIDMREDSLDTPIPERFEPSPYHKDELEKAIAAKEAHVAKSEEELIEEAKAHINKSIEDAKESLQKVTAQNNVLSNMKSKLEGWVPPTQLEEMKTNNHHSQSHRLLHPRT